MDHLIADRTRDSLRDLAAWRLTCSTFNALCSDETRCRCFCFAACPVLFGLALSPVYGAPSRVQTEDGLQLTWKLRAELIKHGLPTGRLIDQGTSSPGMFTYEESADPGLAGRQVEAVDGATGRVHTNVDGDMHNLIAEQPFLNTNGPALLKAYRALHATSVSDSAVADADMVEDAVPTLAAASAQTVAESDDLFAGGQSALAQYQRERTERRLTPADRDQLAPLANTFLFKGVDYFEVTVLRNTVVTNRASAVAVSQWFEAISFLGWNRNSIAYHSDDGTVRRTEDIEVRALACVRACACVACECARWLMSSSFPLTVEGYVRAVHNGRRGGLRSRLGRQRGVLCAHPRSSRCCAHGGGILSRRRQQRHQVVHQEAEDGAQALVPLHRYVLIALSQSCRARACSQPTQARCACTTC
jgi:hypothetical protein